MYKLDVVSCTAKVNLRLYNCWWLATNDNSLSRGVVLLLPVIQRQLRKCNRGCHKTIILRGAATVYTLGKSRKNVFL